ncbi:MAG: class I SAM-dependent methyltransferase [Myxococcaceae bacterium]
MRQLPKRTADRALQEYLWDGERRLFRRPAAAAFRYSDGVEVEQRLLGLMRGVSDRSVFSAELRQAIADWPSEYHLSAFRHCLLRPLAIRPGERVLEVGAGCGALTRYLGELGADVTAVEGSLTRATITSERCRGLPNVKVVNDDLLQFSSPDEFDWLLLVGVLEYAPVFSASPAPARHYLSRLKRFLVPEGNVVVAIENKLGLKYFNGCGEDHLGIPFFGIQDLYGKTTPRTFGRSDLAAELLAAGFPHTRFYYPFPDYKLPSVIFSEEALHSERFNAVDLLLRARSRDYTGRTFRLFHEALVYSSLAENGLFAEFANSFLVVANQASLPQNRTGDLATSYAVARRPEFSTQTRFFGPAPTTQVQKEFLISSPSREAVTEGGMQFHLTEGLADYVQGRQLFFTFLSAQARQEPLETLAAVLQPWLSFLLAHAKWAEGTASTELSALSIEGRFLDCTPFNLLERELALVQIDQEWSTEGDVPLGWVVTRSVMYCWMDGYASAERPQPLARLVQAVVRPAGLVTTEAEVLTWLKDEEQFQKAVTGQDIPLSPQAGPSLKPALDHIHRLDAVLAERERDLVRREAQLEQLEKVAKGLTGQLASLHEALDAERAVAQREACVRDSLAAELSSMKKSQSWRLTTPLRFVKHRVRNLLKPSRRSP